MGFGKNGGSKYSPNNQSWVATEGQTVFTLNNGSYKTGTKTIEVYVGGVKQVSGQHFTETSPTSFTLSEGVPVGTLIEAEWIQGAIPMNMAHNSTHKKGGSDEINIIDIAGYKENVEDKMGLLSDLKTTAKSNLKDAINEHDDRLGNLLKMVINVMAPPAPLVAAKGDGVTDDGAVIQACINYITHAQYNKGGAKLFFPVPSPFYKISATLDLTEIWNVTLECPARYFFQRQATQNIDTDYALFHWYGATNTPMMLLDYSFGITFENISFNGRNIAGVVGLSLSKTATSASSAKFITGTNVDAKYCDKGIRIGDIAANGPDDAGIVFTSSYLRNNITAGLKVNSGNDHVTFINLVTENNGANPATGEIGANVHLVTGELELLHYVSGCDSTHVPKDGDIYNENGGIKIHGAWSDVDHGLFLNGGQAASASILSGVRHYSGGMTTANTPKSIIWQGPQPLVLEGCKLFNNVEVNSGNQGHVIDIGTSFFATGATFTGNAITNFRGYIGMGTAGQNEARLTVGKPPRIDVGLYQPTNLWADSATNALIRSTMNDFVITEIWDGVAHTMMYLGNMYYDDGVGQYKSIKSGECWRLRINKGRYSFETAQSTSSQQNMNSLLYESFSITPFYNGNALGIDGKRLIWNSASPSQGTWNVGDRCFNSAPAVGQPKGWVCTVAGTGAGATWVSEGNL